ncbi:MAG: CoA transferase subunit A, partial [Deltaproteobacteria bacterium]|nr:CoA transferase subunit A [Deltaproteobacteria bacterium]
KNQLPFFLIDAVVLQPYGAYPTACYGCYDYDPEYLKMYQRVAKDDASYAAYLEEYVYGVENHERLFDLVGLNRLQQIKAVSPQGYAAGLDRR